MQLNNEHSIIPVLAKFAKSQCCDEEEENPRQKTAHNKSNNYKITIIVCGVYNLWDIFLIKLSLK